MKLSHSQTVVSSIAQKQHFRSKVTSLCFSPDGKRLAIATSDRVISLYDEKGKRTDKFITKGNGKNKAYVVRSLQFCPEVNDAKLAIAQSDSIVFIYRWINKSTGKETEECHPINKWEGEKSICNKFPESSPVTCLVWPGKHPGEVVYGLSDGKVKLGHLRTNKSQSLYKVDSPVIALTAHINGNAILSAHRDGSVYKFIFPDKELGPSCSKIIQHSCPPYAISWGLSICIGGSNRKVVFFDQDGKEECTFVYDDHERNQDGNHLLCKEFTTASVNHTGKSVVIGNFDSFYLYSYNDEINTWQECQVNVIKNSYSVTAVDWQCNGSILAIGTVCGLVDYYEAAYRHYVYKNIFDITYVSPSQVLVRNKDDVHSIPVLLESKQGDEIMRISFHLELDSGINRYIVAYTHRSLLLCDMESSNAYTSEIPWKMNERKRENFIFDAINACVVSNAGELSIIEFGSSKIVGSVRTEYTSSYLISLRICELPGTNACTKKIAYLLDQMTICIKDLLTKSNTIINHDVALDFLELNPTGSLLIFRDKKNSLYLFDVKHHERKTLLDKCEYVQWVPDSDVVVAQDGRRMCIWYNTQAADQVTVRNINGEIEGIERNGKTEVIVRHSQGVSTYALSEDLIMFTSALENDQLIYAMKILENTIETSDQSRSMWRHLLDASLKSMNLPIAERCAAALGNISGVRYIRKMSKLAAFSQMNGIRDIDDCWQVKVMMCQLHKDFAKAEEIYLSHNKIQEAIQMYEDLMMFSRAINLAEKIKHPDVHKIKERQYAWLINTKQNESAARLKEIEGNYVLAIKLYLNAGMPGKAAMLVSENQIIQPSHLLESVTIALIEADMLDMCGDIYQKIGNHKMALNVYIKGNVFKKAIEMARNYYPNEVVTIEEQFALHLTSLGEFEEAVDHFLEAHSYLKAVESAIKAKCWNRAIEISEQVDRDCFGMDQLYQDIARYFVSVKNFSEAETYFVKSKDFSLVVLMYIHHSLWSEAERSAKCLLTNDEARCIFEKEATLFETGKKYEEAEQLYIYSGQPKKGIDMYKKVGMLKQALNLAHEYGKDSIAGIHQKIAHQLEEQGSLLEAYNHFTEAKDWTGAVKMYKSRDLWDKALHAAVSIGGKDAYKSVAYSYSLHLIKSGDYDGIKSLSYDLISDAIEISLSSNNFSHAFQLAEGHNEISEKIHYKYAIQLEKDGYLDQAEKEFTQAGKFEDASRIVSKLSMKNEVNVAMENKIDVAKEDPSSKIISNTKEKGSNKEIKATLDIFVQKGDWNSVWEMFQKKKDSLKNIDMLSEYTTIRLRELLKDKNILELIAVIKLMCECVAPLPDYRVHLDIYEQLVCVVLSFSLEQEMSTDYFDIIRNLRSLLFAALGIEVYDLHQHQGDSSIDLLLAVHYSYIFHLCKKYDELKDLACMCAITLLRYSSHTNKLGKKITIISSDKAFYIAGILCKDTKHDHLAFKLLNYYVDLVEAMEDKDTTNLCFDDFSSTSLPFDTNIPDEQYISDEVTKEKICDWILQVCIELQDEEEKEGGVYDGLTIGDYPRCMVTGYPVMSKGDTVEKVSYMAIKNYWNRLVGKTGKCPWTGEDISPS